MRVRLCALLIGSVFICDGRMAVQAQSAVTKKSRSADALVSEVPPPTDKSVQATASENTPVIETDPLLLEPTPPRRTLSRWSDAVKLLRARSVNLGLALQDVDRALAAGRVALAAALPTLNATGNMTALALRTAINPLTGTTRLETFPSHALLFGGSATMSIPIFAPRAWYGIGTADRGAELSKLTVEDQERLLLSSLASAIVSVVSADRIAQINRESLRAAISRLSLTERRVQLGSGTQLDVARLKQDVAQAQALIVTANENLREAQEALGLLLGFAEAIDVDRRINLDELVEIVPKSCRSWTNLNDRPDVAAADKNVVIKKRAMHDTHLSFLPTVNINTTFRSFVQPFVTTNVSRTIGLQEWSINGVLSWSIFDGGIRYGTLRDTRAQAEQAQIQADSTRRNAGINVIQADRGIRVAEAALDVAQKASEFAVETDKLSRLNYELGRGSTLDLVDAARILRENQIRLAIREVEMVQAKIKSIIAHARCHLR